MSAHRFQARRETFPLNWLGRSSWTVCDREWKSTLYDDASMPYFLRLNAGATGLHEGFVPRQPASHGCIRVLRGTAQRLFASTQLGDPVTIVKGSLAEKR
jgi:hypothetical protein